MELGDMILSLSELHALLVLVTRPINNHYPPSSIIVISPFEYLAQTDENADANPIISESLSENWRRRPGRPNTTWMKTIQGDLTLMVLGLHDATKDAAKNRSI